MLELPPDFDREAQLQKKSTGLHELDGVGSSFLQIAARMQQLKIQDLVGAALSQRHDVIHVVFPHRLFTHGALSALLRKESIDLRSGYRGEKGRFLPSRSSPLRDLSNLVSIFVTPFSVVFALIDSVVLQVGCPSSARLHPELFAIPLSILGTSFLEKGDVFVIPLSL
jgi:hypothetical protein